MLIGKDAQLFTQMFSLTEAEQAQLPKNVQAVSEFAQRHPGKVTFLLAPSASLIQADRLPAFAPMLDENACTDDILAQVGQSAQVLDVRELFTQNKDEKPLLLHRPSLDHPGRLPGLHRLLPAAGADSL